VLRELIRERLAGTTPGAPEDVHVPGVSGDLPAALRRVRVRRLVPAAVLIPLIEHADGLTVMLTRRADDLKHHPGQISFPGGRLEDVDTGPADAALRETWEETGLETDRVEVVGYLDNYLTITGYSVTPVVGFVQPGFDYVPDETEVAEIFEVPLSHLFDPVNVVRRHKRFMGVRLPYFEIPYGRHNIWGATAGMLVGFRNRIYPEETS
jgi:8-oxo-dGTP pyrophosphatase MutT (NUDIX family)